MRRVGKGSGWRFFTVCEFAESGARGSQQPQTPHQPYFMDAKIKMRRWCMGLGLRVCQLCQPGRARRLKPFLVHCFAPPQVPEAQPSSIHTASLSSKNNRQWRPELFLFHYFARSPNNGGIFRSFSPSPNLGLLALAWPWHPENGISYCPNCFFDIIPPLNLHVRYR